MIIVCVQETQKDVKVENCFFKETQSERTGFLKASDFHVLCLNCVYGPARSTRLHQKVQQEQMSCLANILEFTKK